MMEIRGLYTASKGEWELVLPTESEQDELQRMIEDSKSVIRPKVNDRMMEILEALTERGAEVLVLGCTDFGTLIPRDWRPKAVVMDPIDNLIELAGNIGVRGREHD